MYIAKLKIENFRCFRDTTIEFCPGMNVIIGPNNVGKTTVLKALELIFNRGATRSITFDDFNKYNEDFSDPPEIKIAVVLRSTDNDTPEDKVIVASWLTKLDAPWEATLTYRFFLPEKNAAKYRDEISKVVDNDKKWGIVEKYLPKYVSRILGGNPDNNLRADSEYLDKFHCEILNALRDADREISSGRNSLLKQILLYFKDRGSDGETIDSTEYKQQFNQLSQSLVDNIISRIDENDVLKLAKKTGASVGGVPGLNGKLAESDVLSVLKLIIKSHTNYEIPIAQNGLGYNNLIYISLILSKFKVITSEEQGENAKAFPILLIEEPEAHLHPSLQYNFLKFLKEEVESQKYSRQIFITTHSTQITSAVGLDSIICLETDDDINIEPKYPAKVFSCSKEDQKSKRYVERFLDATKSAMLFAESVLFVEGTAEQILFPVLAEKCGFDLDRSHVALIKVDSSTFKHFIKLFGANVCHKNKIYALNKKVACVIDADPIKRDMSKKTGKGSGWTSCWPFEIDTKGNFRYREFSHNLTNLIEMIGENKNVRAFFNQSGYGKTLEYDLAFDNSKTEFFCSNYKELEGFNEIVNESWTDEDKDRAKVASGFLCFAEEKKGEVAFEVADLLKQQDSPIICVPQYIIDAIRWVCSNKVGDLVESNL